MTIITDAGFHREWFQQVLELGWDVIGRIYSLYCYQIEGETNWHKVKDILFEGIGKASALGKVKLGKTKKAVEGYLYTYKETLSGKVRKRKINILLMIKLIPIIIKMGGFSLAH